MKVAEIRKDFERHHAEHSSAKTLRFYRQGLAWLNPFDEIEWDALDRLALRDALYKSHFWPDGRPMADATQRRNKVAFELLQAHAIDQDFTTRQVLTKKDLKKPGSGQREQIPTDDELDQTFAAADPAFALALRGLAACGMRPGDLCRSRLEDITTNAKGIRSIVLKEHKTAKKIGAAKKIAIGETLTAVITEAAGDRTAGEIWRDEKGQPWTPPKLSRRWRDLRRRLNLPEGRPLYTVRHYVGTETTRAAGIHAAKELLQHKSINITQRYAHGDESDQLAAQDALDKALAARRSAA